MLVASLVATQTDGVYALRPCRVFCDYMEVRMATEEEVGGIRWYDPLQLSSMPTFEDQQKQRWVD
jgi:hypothetical protein